MKLVIFDVDGTLLEYAPFEDACYARAVAGLIGPCEIDTDWSHYENVTDTGLVEEYLLKHHQYKASAEDLELVERLMLVELQRCHAETGWVARPIAGAVRMLQRLVASEDWVVAIATGAWRSGSEFKQNRAGFSLAPYPTAWADDARTREELVLTALERARLYYEIEQFERIVSVGDGLWDARAATRLGLPFIAIGQHERRAAFEPHGVSHVLADFRDAAAFEAALRDAAIPNYAGARRAN